MTLLHLGDILSKGDIKECREYYQEDPGDALDLATVVQEMERPLDVVTDGTYSALLSDRWSEADSVWTQYSSELRGIYNNLDELRNRRCYEFVHKPFIPLITTIGGRIDEDLLNLIWRKVRGLPSSFEEVGRKLDFYFQNGYPLADRSPRPYEQLRDILDFYCIGK